MTLKVFLCEWLVVVIALLLRIGHTEGRAGMEIEGMSISSVLSKFGQIECEVLVKHLVELLSR